MLINQREKELICYCLSLAARNEEVLPEGWKEIPKPEVTELVELFDRPREEEKKA